jgi:hypothetical protein
MGFSRRTGHCPAGILATPRLRCVLLKSIFCAVAVCLPAGCTGLPAAARHGERPTSLGADRAAVAVDDGTPRTVPVEAPVRLTAADFAATPPATGDVAAAPGLGVRDLVAVVGLLDGIERVDPGLKANLLGDLAGADAATLPDVIARWQTRLAELPLATQPVPPATPADAAPQPANREPAATAAASAEPGRELVPALSRAELFQELLAETRERAAGEGPDAVRSEVQLALLELLWQCDQDPSRASAADTELWKHLAPAVQLCLAAGPSGNRTAAEVIDSLRLATEMLRGPGRLQAKNLAFCRRIRGYGNVDRIESTAFTRGQPMLLYSEVEHFFTEPVLGGGFRTRLSSTLELLDAAGDVVWSQEFAAVEDHSSGPRRDYFMSHSFRLPANLATGRYYVRLTLHDELADRSALAVD